MIEKHFAYCGNQYFHVMTGDPGDVIPTHRHTYGHVFQVLAGEIEIRSEKDGAKRMRPGDLFDVPAGVAHELVFLKPRSVGQCVHIFRFDDGTEVPFDYELTPRDVMQMTRAM